MSRERQLRAEERAPRDGARALVRLELPNDLRALEDARARARAALSAANVEVRALDAVELILEELVGNAIRYGFDGETSVLRVAITPRASDLLVELVDAGRPFDPTGYPPPAKPKSIADATVGGRGIQMVRAVVSAMRYRRRGDENHLELVVPRR
ncbi:MAG: ATP-binding protein [Planctomycetes bacterium]|nr:ATP-binding protein [Planctomycetota bacterium]